MPRRITSPRGTQLTCKNWQIEAAYRIRIPDANYWYDPVLGAWGPRGGPIMGFILPGLNIGGPLQEDASGGGTNVFVNGRELHPYDLMALQQIAGLFVAAQRRTGRQHAAHVARQIVPAAGVLFRHHGTPTASSMSPEVQVRKPSRWVWRK